MRAFRILLIALSCLVFSPAYAATTLLPNGKQCFSNANGPIISGSVNMFVPSTTNPKATWQDANQTTLNSVPIQLDAAGCAIIYGVGQYRQQVFTGPVVGGVTTGTLVWDQLTTDTSAFNSVFWAGLSAGTPNVITVVDTGFNGTDGTVIQFVALATNTGAATLNPSGFGAISIVKDTTAGPIALTGGEITANNVISVVYYATSNTFHLLNTVVASASGATAPLCGASGLVITNNAGTPNSIITITARQALTQTTAGLVLNRSNVSTSVNIGIGTVTSTAGGMDGESPGTSAWVDLFLIDNGSAINALGTAAAGNGQTPNMPSGYTYKCYIGAMRVDAGGNLLRMRQNGGRVAFQIAGTTTPPVLANGVTGTFSLTNPVLTSTSVTTCVPPTATQIQLTAVSAWKAGAPSNILAAASTAWGGTANGPQGANGLVWPIYLLNTSTSSPGAWLMLESQAIGVAMDAAGGAIGCLGYQDAVNAN